MTRAHVTAEFKARCPNPQEAILRARASGAHWANRERQIDACIELGGGAG